MMYACSIFGSRINNSYFLQPEEELHYNFICSACSQYNLSHVIHQDRMYHILLCFRRYKPKITTHLPLLLMHSYKQFTIKE